MKVRRALLSAWRKDELVEFARQLSQLGVELLASDGTAQVLRSAGIPVQAVSELTGFPPILDGRVKTLHPLIHAALLARRDVPEHMEQLRRFGVEPIDLVAVDFYPFEQALDSSELDAGMLELIDIGGPALVRAAAKNYPWVTVVVQPAQYGEVIALLREHGEVPESVRRRYAAEAFARTAAYDATVAAALRADGDTPQWWVQVLPLAQELRYGENPHQRGWLYGSDYGRCFQQLHGKELSYNNVLDADAAVRLILEFEAPTVAILKHTAPCGVGSDEDLVKAWEKAWASDPISPFGGVVVVNRPLGAELAERLASVFLEQVLAPDFSEEALALLQRKRNLRLLRYNEPLLRQQWEQDFRSILGGVLVQTSDVAVPLRTEEWQVVTQREPTPAEWEALRFAWRVVKHVKSNAIVFAGPDRTLAIGGGQPSRLDAVRVAVRKARESGPSLSGSVVASDAFFPFPDAVEEAIAAGATAVVQPGGSVRDAEVIAAADAHGVAMVFTGTRHFRH
ncbi:MAG: bifunctional phosphoribosylaminoimidazolecarboxamide formyltransferase/IMP cyclohydrolase [Candidatus Kapabacteria bacterium]|nr:bifunctional phosphoribosylaminoimidazolecarboxamide formyltransferase/IMP cyclohydrolase [Candidatus Kapabacteria bacterium]MDW8011746.1 bifunctional phosphoribosylaminoimidazolecarboxamide formyltransferase/IMP cyclohydrolase [Bacteroidota bacterium]